MEGFSELNRDTVVYGEDLKTKRRGDTHDVVSRIAYLIGVPKRIFDNESEPLKPEIYSCLDKDKNARIIRHLCVVRCAIMRNFGRIVRQINREHRSILFMPEYVPAESLMQLEEDGVNFYKKSSTNLHQHLIEINRIVSDRINNCKPVFPAWLKWEYIRSLFIMPNGLNEKGTQDALTLFFENASLYPYQVYINWLPTSYGNILYNDKKFVTLLYEWNRDCFTDFNRVSDAGSFVKSSIGSFVDSSNKLVIAVDCENSDPYHFCAMLKGLDSDTADRIQKIILFDDVNTVDAWRILEGHTHIPVEHIMTERVVQTKSLVDIELTARICIEYYKEDVDSFIIVSSDSDYWGLISSLPEARFLMMVERGKCSPDMKIAMANSGIFYCYIDDFYTAGGDNIRDMALFTELHRQLDKALSLNGYYLLEAALKTTRIDMSHVEKMRFYEQYIKTMQLEIDDNGNVSIELRRK